MFFSRTPGKGFGDYGSCLYLSEIGYRRWVHAYGNYVLSSIRIYSPFLPPMNLVVGSTAILLFDQCNIYIRKLLVTGLSCDITTMPPL